MYDVMMRASFSHSQQTSLIWRVVRQKGSSATCRPLRLSLVEINDCQWQGTYERRCRKKKTNSENEDTI